MKWLVSVLLTTGLISSGWAADPAQFTKAEKALFVVDHLQALKPPVTLTYQYRRGGSLQSPIDGSARLELTDDGSGRSAKVTFLSGADELKLPPFAGVKGNPLVLYFLEREIREMNRLTGGSLNYYRKRIRMALATEPMVRERTVDFEGRKIKATEIRIEPYVRDPARSRYEKFADKSFVILLSDEVPGSLLSMHSVLKAPDNPKVWTETLTYQSKQ